MNTMEVLIEQAELHKLVNYDFDAFTTIFKDEGDLTESVYRNAEHLLRHRRKVCEESRAFSGKSRSRTRLHLEGSNRLHISIIKLLMLRSLFSKQSNWNLAKCVIMIKMLLRNLSVRAILHLSNR